MLLAILITSVLAILLVLAGLMDKKEFKKHVYVGRYGGGRLDSRLDSGLDSRLGRNPTARIIVGDQQSGVLVDVQVVATALRAAGAIVSIESATKKRKPLKPVFLQVFIEHVYVQNIMQHFPAAWNFIYINPEFLYDWDIEALKKNELTALCKTKAAVTNLAALGITGIYSGFSGVSDKLPAVRDKTKFALHIAGTSPLKGTRLVLDAWSFVKTDPDVFLFVVCWGYPNKKVLDYWDSLSPQDLKISKLPLSSTLRQIWGDDPADQIQQVGSIFLYRQKMTEKTLVHLRSIAQVILCPSVTEGWGHTLDEARRAGAVSVTLDAPPMNELFDSQTGILVSAEPGPPVQMLMPQAWGKYYAPDFHPATFTTTPEKFGTAVRDALIMPAAHRVMIGTAARLRAQQDVAAFMAFSADLWSHPWGRDIPAQLTEYAEYTVGEAEFDKKNLHSHGAVIKYRNYDDTYVFRINRRDAFIQESLRKGFIYGKYVTISLSVFAPVDAVFVDVGANIGTVSIPMSRVNDGRIQVLSFEPFIGNYKLFYSNSVANKCSNIVVFPLALGHTNMSAQMSADFSAPVREEGRKITTAVRVVNIDEKNAEINFGAMQLGSGGTVIRMISLDSLRLPKLDLLKVDVEGAEPLVFYGACETIKRYLPVIVFESNKQTVTPDMIKTLQLPDLVINFSILEYCATLGYNKIIELDIHDYVLVPPNRKEVNPSPVFKYRPVRGLSTIASKSIPAGYQLFKLNKPKW